jgi:homoprotocatechuate degradation regulator HpaR
MLAKHGVTEQQWRVVRVLSEASPLDATEVARRAAILAPSLTRIIKALEERRLIRRDKLAEDGRRVMLSITSSGEGLIESVSPERAEIYKDLEIRYGAANLKRLLDLLDTLIDRME